MSIKRAVASASLLLHADPLALYSLPFREIIEWCEVAASLQVPRR